jgi:parallel beta-helix repeat protein
MIDLATEVTFRDLYLENTGLYGVYPVEVVGVLVERCTVTGVRDAGIYVGQSKDIVVRDSEVYGNVTGIEIENSLNAIVENNEVYNNTAGVLVFGLPNNPSKISKNCKVINNRIYDNNLGNFGDPTAIVSRTPSGSGVIIMAGDEVEVSGNEIRGNNSFGIGVSGLDQFFEPGMSYDIDPTSDNCWIHDNTLIDNGGDPHQSILDAGFEGADLLWDVTGEGNRWDQPGASRLPYVLPGPDWSGLRYRANERLWRLVMQIL